MGKHGEHLKRARADAREVVKGGLDGDLSAERPALIRRRAALQGPGWPSRRTGCNTHPEQAAGLLLPCRDGGLRCSESRR